MHAQPQPRDYRGSRATIPGKRVLLRELRWEDMDEMERWPPFREPDLQWANFDLHTQAQKDAWFRQELYDPTRKRFAIIVDRRLIGVLGLRSIDYRHGRATLGIRLSSAEVNKGHGTDAINAVLGYAFTKMRLSHIDLDVAEGNRRAQRCYEKCGFRYIGLHQDLRGMIYLDMTISTEEFAARQHQQGPLPL